MSTISDAEYEKHLAGVVAEGFALNPSGFERLILWNHLLLNCVSASESFRRLQLREVRLGKFDDVVDAQALFVAGIMAYGRCFSQSGPGIPTLDPKQVYKGSDDGMRVHRRMIELRNTVAAHSDVSELARFTLAVREEEDRLVIRHLATTAMPINDLHDFREAVEHTAHFVTISINKLLDHLSKKLGKRIVLD